jgi:hypothetical protein
MPMLFSSIKAHFPPLTLLILSILYGRTALSQTTCQKKDQTSATICVYTQGDSTTAQSLSAPVVTPNGTPLTIKIGPLSPIESCSLASVTSTPSTTTDQASISRLIGVLLAGSVAAPPIPAGTSVTPISSGVPYLYVMNSLPSGLVESSTTQSPADTILTNSENELTEATKQVNKWQKRRQAAIDSLSDGQRLLTVAARQPDTQKPGTYDPLALLSTFTDCLNEEAKSCPYQGEKTPAEAVNAQAKMDDESELQKISQELAHANDLLKNAPVKPDCTKGTASEKEKCLRDYKAALEKYSIQQENLAAYQAQLAGLQSDDTKLRAGEASLTALYAQASKVLLHANIGEVYKRDDLNDKSGFFEILNFMPSWDSDLTASVTCTSILDNSTTLSPVPIILHEGVPRFIFSAGGLFALTPTQTVGIVQVADTSSTGFHSAVGQTGSNSFQVIPFAFETWIPEPLKNSILGATAFGITGGVGINPYSGVQGVDFFSGFSLRYFDKIYVHGGIHSGRFVYTDPHANLPIGATIPSGFGTSVPTITRFTHHAAFGFSYSF